MSGHLKLLKIVNKNCQRWIYCTIIKPPLQAQKVAYLVTPLASFTSVQPISSYSFGTLSDAAVLSQKLANNNKQLAINVTFVSIV